ncbi:fimbria/pilus outer membrane usher protein [Acinetobacter sp. ANC 3813]|uniref:fimbria/pilus outer membrane usher protein n=1 Tax=Acinetobacter sp. ANC 3813 TaxID=1977873 RepID=UPI000A3482E8|nr:fimbria/pilus outer membrane usher protein [Acinetobacter sp. ANC 3813]OTG91617.1 hypothetical protein B9T34_04760 [Acinetobacter sp. ANC 3813]
MVIRKLKQSIPQPAVLLLVVCCLHTEIAVAQNVLTETPQADAADTPTVKHSIAGIWVNGIDLQKEALVIRQNNQLFIECAPLKTGFVNISRFSFLNNNNAQYCLIDRPDIGIEVDEKSQLLKLSIPVQYLQNQKLHAQQAAKLEFPGLGGFINYNTYFQDGDYNKQLSASTDLNIFWKNMLFNSGHLFQKDYENNQDSDFKSSRLNTSLSFEFPEQMTTLKLGDNISTYTGLNQSFYFGGLSFGTNFTSRSGFTYWNTPSIQGSALTQSSVDLIINGAQAYSGRVNPGQFSIDSNIGFNGLGSADIIVKDVLGNTKVQSMDIFVNQRLLRPGLTDYNLSVGKLRYNYAFDDEDYRDWFGSTYVRHGISEYTTLGAVADYSKSLESAGLLWSQYLYKMGLLEINSAYSRVDDWGLDGYTVNAEFKRDLQDYSIGLRSQYYSEDFRMLGLDDYKTGYLPKQEHQVYLSKYNIPVLNNLSLSYVERNYRPVSQTDQKIFNLRSSRHLARGLFGSLGVSYDAVSKDNASFDLMLSYTFNDSRKSASFSQRDEHETSLQFSHSTSENTGFDYSIGASRSHDVYSGNLSTRIKTNAGDLGLQYLQTDNRQYYSANYMGSVVWLGKNFDLSKYINNSFSLIRLEGSPDVDIYSNGSHIGKTDKNGEIFSYNLYGYTQNNIGFDETQLSVERNIDETYRAITPLHQRGYVIEFKIPEQQETRDAKFRFVDSNQKTIEKGSIVNFVSEENAKYPVGSNEMITVYGLTNKHYRIEVQTDTAVCKSEFDLNTETQTDQPITLICK